MEKQFETFETVVPKAAGVAADHPLAKALMGRENIMELTQKSHDAVLMPNASGGLSHAVRAALACRIARHNNETVLADHFLGMIGNGDDANSATMITDLAFVGGDNAWLKAIVRHTDLVAVSPKEATAQDIEALKAVGVPDDDIVRLSELNAFVSYQIRLVVGLRLMAEVA
ncbi:MAG: hypothetical protein O2821_13625 [Chloroflexi bacterium]|nr:hypothetical protein [Chloroflexota bacterium]MDA1229034.1 hypothetical protein [Chloroflexota bacterium]